MSSLVKHIQRERYDRFGLKLGSKLGVHYGSTGSSWPKHVRDVAVDHEPYRPPTRAERKAEHVRKMLGKY